MATKKIMVAYDSSIIIMQAVAVMGDGSKVGENGISRFMTIIISMDRAGQGIAGVA